MVVPPSVVGLAVGPLELGQLALFLAAAGAMVLSPGPDTVYVLGRGLVDRRGGLSAALGTTAGILTHTAAVAFGVALLLRTSPIAFEAVRVGGAIYLTALGIRTIRRRNVDLSARGVSDSPLRSFAGGYAVNVLNPQVLVFFLSFLPQFVDTARRETPQLLALGGTYAVLTIVYLGAVATAAAAARDGLLESQRRVSILRVVTGLVLVAFGLQLAVQFIS